MPFTPNHVRLVEACYPPAATLLAPDSDHRPNAQELSRLTYYASNRTTKIPKVGTELDRLIKVQARKANAGYARARAELIVTLGIYLALITECKRDVALILRHAVASVDSALSALPKDLEVSAKAAGVFTALVTFSDGHLIGVDAQLTKDYTSVLSHFSKLSCKELNDAELQNRTRLVGFASLSALVDSEMLYASVHEFKKQASIIVPAILLSLYKAGITTLADESSAVKSEPNPSTPYLSEFSPRPNAERRAPSIHTHVDGEKGPEYSDVVNICLRIMMSLLGKCLALQISQVLEAAMDWMESNKVWDDPEFCRWLAGRATEWSQYQYRYAVPTKLMDRLLEVQDAPEPTSLHFSLISMLTAVFKSPHPLANLSTSDNLGHLITVALRRISINPNDPLIPALVECTAALGTHVYYADQIQDMAEELVSRLVGLQSTGSLNQGRPEAIRCLLACLTGLMKAAEASDAGPQPSHGDAIVDSPTQEVDEPNFDVEVVPPSGMDHDTPANPETVLKRSLRRNRITPELWQETLILLCESEFGVRASYARALHRFISSELMAEPFVKKDARGVRVVIDAEYQPPSRPSPLLSDQKSRFVNALHASMYMVATASSLGIPKSNSPVSSSHALALEVNIIAATPTPSPGTQTENKDPLTTEPDAGAEPLTVEGSEKASAPNLSRRSSAGPQRTPPGSRSRKSSLALKLLEPGPNLLNPSPGTSPALASDYAHLLEVLTVVHEKLPCRAVISGVPMLLMLDSSTKLKGAQVDEDTRLRIVAVKHLIARTWLTIGRVWGCEEVVKAAERALAPSTISSEVIPLLPDSPLLAHFETEKSASWAVPDAQAQDSSLEMPCLDPETVLTALASSQSLQLATGLDRGGILRRLSVPWSIETALEDSVERVSSDILRGETPLLKISPALMHIENLSLASIARSSRGVGVGDLREALGGRGSMSNPALVQSQGGKPGSVGTNGARSISTYDRQGSSHYTLHPVSSRPTGTARRTPKRQGDVRDVLNKLGIGKQTNGVDMVQMPFTALKGASTAKVNIGGSSSA